MEATDPLLGQKVGNYVLVRSLGAGGMGAVYLAEHPDIGRRVAVKFLMEDDGEQNDYAQRFLLEARAVARIQHPNIVEIYDYGRLGHRVYYTMELLDGCDLRRFLSADKRLTPRDCVPYVKQICDALTVVHDQNVVHRDLKPENIFVLNRPTPTVKLFDFGVARVPDPERPDTTIAGQVLETPTHMAPEQIVGRSEEIGPATDIYSLGVVLYEMLSGRLPFRSDQVLRVMAMHLLEEAPLLSAFEPTLPSELVELVARCLKKRPDERPRSAAEVAAAYEHATMAPATQRLLVVIPKTQTVGMETDASGATMHAGNIPLPNLPLAKAPVLLEATQQDPASIQATPTQQTQQTHARIELSLPKTRMETLLAAHRAPATHTTSASLPPPSSTINPLATEIVDRVLQRMKKIGDLPSLSGSAKEVRALAHADAITSSTALAEAVLRDPPLTLRVLRQTQSPGFSQSSAKVTTISRAIVVMGFDHIHSLARSARTIDAKELGKAGPYVDSLVTSVVCGDLARRIATEARVRNPEEAFIAASFRNLGKQLLQYYLPETYQQVVTYAQERNMREARAAVLVMGQTYEELGRAVGEHWHLPERALAGMGLLPSRVEAAHTEQERVHLVASFATEVVETLRELPEGLRPMEFDRIRVRYQRAISLDAKRLDSAINAVCSQFRDDGARLFGPELRRSPLAVQLASIPPPSDAPPNDEAPLAILPARVEVQNTPKHVLDALATVLDGRLALIARAKEAHRDRDYLLRIICESITLGFGFARCMFLEPGRGKRTFIVSVGAGAQASRLLRLEVPIGAKGPSADAVSSAYHAGTEVVVEDLRKAGPNVPAWFRNAAAGVRTLHVYAVSAEGQSFGVFLCDGTEPHAPLDAHERSYLDRLSAEAVWAFTNAPQTKAK